MKRHALPQKECQWCHKMFTPMRSGAIYCCHEHQYEAQKARKRASHVLDLIPCAICGELFIPKSHNSSVCNNPECRKTYRKKWNSVRWTSYPEFNMPDEYCGKRMYFDGLHPVRGSQFGRDVDPVLGF